MAQRSLLTYLAENVGSRISERPCFKNYSGGRWLRWKECLFWKQEDLDSDPLAPTYKQGMFWMPVISTLGFRKTDRRIPGTCCQSTWQELRMSGLVRDPLSKVKVETGSLSLHACMHAWAHILSLFVSVSVSISLALDQVPLLSLCPWSHILEEASSRTVNTFSWYNTSSFEFWW